MVHYTAANRQAFDDATATAALAQQQQLAGTLLAAYVCMCMCECMLHRPGAGAPLRQFDSGTGLSHFVQHTKVGACDRCLHVDVQQFSHCIILISSAVSLERVPVQHTQASVNRSFDGVQHNLSLQIKGKS